VATGLELPVVFHDPIPFAVDENGEQVSVSLVERSVLIGGQPGTGKSSALQMLVAAAALDPSVRLTVLDPKVVELAAWARCAETAAGPDVAEAIESLRSIQSLMDARYGDLLAAGLRKITSSPDLPLHVIVIDELSFYTGAEDRKQRDVFVGLLRDVVARGRAGGFIVLAATQRPSTDIVPSSLRDLFALRVAFRSATRDHSDVILGTGYASLGYDASTIPLGEPGVGFLLAEESAPQRIRTYYIDDETVGLLAERAAAIRKRG
jgi:S-DNA-T family DNA segregation ATPase FtsK/SpoIIIE